MPVCLHQKFFHRSPSWNKPESENYRSRCCNFGCNASSFVLVADQIGSSRSVHWITMEQAVAPFCFGHARMTQRHQKHCKRICPMTSVIIFMQVKGQFSQRNIGEKKHENSMKFWRRKHKPVFATKAQQVNQILYGTLHQRFFKVFQRDRLGATPKTAGLLRQNYKIHL